MREEFLVKHQMLWAEALAPSSKVDGYLRLSVTILLLIWNWLVATHMQTPYPMSLVDAYALPLTRVFLLLLVIASALWCPTVGIMAALAYVCLGADVLNFTR
jgi:hypothetical protein